MALCLQWYWVDSTSSDIQTVADLGALGAADVVAQTVMIMQALDAFLLTLNLFGLLLHCIVVVSGIVVAVTAPAGGTSTVTFFEKAVKFDKDFCDKRKQIISEVETFATALASATPALAYAGGARVVEKNQSYLGEDNQSNYQAIIIPAPLTGSVRISNDPDGLEEWEEGIRETGTRNHESAQRIKELETDVEAAIDECYRLDEYKKPGTARAFWDPSFALADFRAEWEQVKTRSLDPPSTPLPIDNNESTRQKAGERYIEYYRNLGTRLGRKVLDAIGPDPLGDTPMKPAMIDINELTRDEWNAEVLLLDHSAGERKAYHERPDCFGLSNASSELRRVKLVSIKGDQDHPPCTWCGPSSWKSIQMLEDDMRIFVDHWNKEAQAILVYEALRQQLAEEIDQTRERTISALEGIREMAGSYLVGGRLTYEPAGGRGIWCIVVSASTRSLPEYTQPALTGAQDVTLGSQIAVAGVRLMPSSTESTLPSFLKDADASEASSEGLGGVVRSIFGDDEIVLSMGLTLWGSCLDLYTRQVEGMYQLSGGLPWGLDGVMEDTLDGILETAQIGAPDMKKPIPTLVPVTEVGSGEAGGVESALVQMFGSGRELLESTGGLSTYGIKEHIRSVANELSSETAVRVEEMLTPTIGGIPLRLPFADLVSEYVMGAVDGSFNRALGALYQLPDVSW
jgi:hypothetical protein